MTGEMGEVHRSIRRKLNELFILLEYSYRANAPDSHNNIWDNKFCYWDIISEGNKMSPYVSVGNTVYKKTSSGRRGKKVGTARHASVSSYLRALYANTKGK